MDICSWCSLTVSSKQLPGEIIYCSTEACDLSEMDLLLKFQVLPFSTLTTEILQVLVEKLRRGRHTKARNGSTQAAFLLFPYCFQWWTDDYCVSQAPSRKQKAPSTGNRLVSLRAEGVEDGLPWNAATGRGNRHQRLSSPSELSQ